MNFSVQKWIGVNAKLLLLSMRKKLNTTYVLLCLNTNLFVYDENKEYYLYTYLNSIPRQYIVLP